MSIHKHPVHCKNKKNTMWWAAAGIAYVAGPSAVLALVNAAVSMTVRATVRATWYVGQHVGQHIAAVLSPTPQFVPHTVVHLDLGPQFQDGPAGKHVAVGQAATGSAAAFAAAAAAAAATAPQPGQNAAVVIQERGAVGAPPAA
jgi:hypothetical protein